MALGALALGAFCLIPGAGRAASGSEFAHKWNDKGVALLDKGHYEEAVKAFAEAMRLTSDEDTVVLNHALALNAWGVSLGQAGRYEEGVKRIEEAKREAPGRDEIQSNLIVLQVNWASNLMLDGDFDGAAKRLDAAQADAGAQKRELIDSRRAQNLTLWARQALADGDRETAAKRLEDALGLEPENVAALMDLATVYFDDGDSAEALTLYEQAVALGGEAGGLSERIEKLRREVAAEANFREFTSRNFRIAYEGKSNAEAARRVLKILTAARREIGSQFSYPSDPVPVVLYTMDQYRQVTLAPHWSGAVYDGKIRIPLSEETLSDANEANFRRTLYHEFTHALVREIGGDDVPIWLNEGLATYYEIGRDERRERALKDDLEIDRLFRKRRLTAVFRLPAEFVSIKDEDDAQRAYLLARAFTTWLSDKYGSARFKPLLGRIKEGETIDEACLSVYGRNLADLDRLWRRELED